MNNWIWNPPSRAEWPRLLLECVVIATLGLVVGLSVNGGVLRQVIEGQGSHVDVTQGELLPVPVGLEEVRELLAAGALPVDARLPEEYAEGHLPKARNLPLAEQAGFLAEFKKDIESSRVLVVYCNGYGCPDSFDLAQILMHEGFQDVRVFEGGFPEWQDAGLPIAGATP